MASRSYHSHLQLARFLAHSLDTQFNIAGFKFGFGPLIGLIPGFGDIITNALSFYMIWIGLQMNIPTPKIAQMLGNIAFNFFMGLIPFLGDIGDFAFKSNMRNLQIIEEYAQESVVEGEIVSTS